MARYLPTSESNFKPFSFDEMVAPLKHMQERHDTASYIYDELDMETEAIRQYITDNPDDSVARDIYNNYSSKLQALKDNLWNKGVTATTGRDLSKARSSFNEMGKVKTAIQNRRDRSAAYWNARHSNPDLVASADPGKAGLNSYLADENYGLDWYSYSGTKFMTEVGTDAKARMKELFSDPSINKDKIKGYIEIMTKEGASSDEIQKAANAVRKYFAGDVSAYNALEDKTPQKILADVLMSHIDSTGAKGKLDKDEFNRLVEYGVDGLSQAVGDTKYDYKQNLEWVQQQNEAAAARQYNRDVELKKWDYLIKHGGMPNGNTSDGLGHSSTIRPPMYDKAIKYTTKQDRVFENNGGFVNIKMPNGPIKKVAGTYDMTHILYDSDERENWRKKIRGLDFALEPGKDETYSYITGNGDEKTVTVGKMSRRDAMALGITDRDGLYVVKNSDGAIMKNLTNDLNSERERYYENVRKIIDMNYDIDILGMVITPKQQDKMRRDLVPDNMKTASWSDVVNYMYAHEPGVYSPGIIVTSEKSDNDRRADMAKNSIVKYMSEPEDGSVRGVYRVNDSKVGHVDEPVDYLTSIGTDNAKLDSDGLLAINMPIENFLYDIPMVRFQSVTGEYDAYPELFGPEIYNAVNKPVPVYSGELNETMLFSTATAVKHIMNPIIHPDIIWSMSPKQIDEWGEWCCAILGADEENNKFPFKTIIGKDGNKTVEPISLFDVLRDTDNDYRSYIRSRVLEDVINKAFSRIHVID